MVRTNAFLALSLPQILGCSCSWALDAGAKGLKKDPALSPITHGKVRQAVQVSEWNLAGTSTHIPSSLNFVCTLPAPLA